MLYNRYELKLELQNMVRAIASKSSNLGRLYRHTTSPKLYWAHR